MQDSAYIILAASYQSHHSRCLHPLAKVSKNCILHGMFISWLASSLVDFFHNNHMLIELISDFKAAYNKFLISHDQRLMSGLPNQPQLSWGSTGR